jgi:transposase
MLTDGSFSFSQIAAAAECSKNAVKAISTNLKCFGSTTAPRNGGRRPRCITQQMLDTLCEHPLTKADQYLDEMAVILWDEFEVWVSESTISGSLRAAGWSRKIARRVAHERNADLRDTYLHNLSTFRSYHLVYVDESGCDRRGGFRRSGWSPLGITPTQVARLQRGQRYQILPAYTQDGVLLSRVFRGSTDSDVFEDFIGQLLTLCSR